MRIVRNVDVASYYPHLMTVNGYTSRAIPDPKIYEEMLERRMRAKKSGDKVTANALKLIANTTYGATLNRYNDLYDPLMARSVCISGQLYLLELANHMLRDIPDLKVLQMNTDGLMVEFDDSQYSKVQEILVEWQDRTGFELEEDKIKAIYQKDVNGYIEVATDGSFKIKGGYLVRGIAPVGAFNINNNFTIVSEAIVEHFVHKVPARETITNCDDSSKFQIIAKAGSKYKRAYQLVDGNEMDTQKVNRVFSSKDTRLGKLYKVHGETDRVAQIESLPDHCLICNEGFPDISLVDKEWYINLAESRIRDFEGIKETKEKKGRKTKMATAKPMNVYQKLLAARVKFLESGVKKSGMNRMLSFKYFELDDIVPVATKIFNEVGLVPTVNFGDESAVMMVVNTDDPTDAVSFTCSVKKAAENKGVTEIQSYGASMTYTRRYLYYLALDVCEPDQVDAAAPVEDGKDTNVPSKPATVSIKAPAKPATPAQREEVKKELTAPDGDATELQIKQLKSALKTLRDKHPDDDTRSFIREVGLKTGGFTNVTKKDCEALMIEIGERMEATNA